MKLVLASNNKHKADEYRAMFKNEHFNNLSILTPNELTDMDIEVEETGSTFEENALIKAKHIFHLTKHPCFSDDSGLEVTSLAGKPGIHSARYSGTHGNDKENRQKIISELQKLHTEDWSAQFRCVICFYDGKKEYYFEGICKGKIIDEEKGAGGFGYDPIFIPEGYDITFAEMRPDEKNKISHRAIALKTFQEFLISYKE